MNKCTVILYTRCTIGDGYYVAKYKHCVCPAFDEGHLEKGSVCFMDEHGKVHVAFVDSYEVEEE